MNNLKSKCVGRFVARSEEGGIYTVLICEPQIEKGGRFFKTDLEQRVIALSDGTFKLVDEGTVVAYESAAGSLGVSLSCAQ